jgi:hypothetical protein
MSSLKSSPPSTISTDIIEAPSPAPIPPSVIHAETAEPLFITRCQYIKDYSNDSVKINIHKTDINEKFIKIIENTSDTWYNFHNHFQNDFTKFYELLNSSLKGECRHIRSNIHYLNGQIQLTLIHEGMFPFTIMIILEKEKEKIDILEDTINRILRENIYLKQQNEMILSKLNKNINDYEFLEIQGSHFQDIYYNSGQLENYSGEEMTSLENMKRRMIDNNYTSCIVYKNKLYYQKRGYGWKWELENFDISSNKEIYDNAKTYVCIPKDDIQNIGPGVGKLSNYNDHINYLIDKPYYHGYIDTYNGPGDISIKIIKDKYHQKNRGHSRDRDRDDSYRIPICTPHMFCVRDKFIRQDISPDICKPCGEYSQIKFNDGKTGRNIIPSKYYCTNCREVGSGDGYTVYECLGH